MPNVVTVSKIIQQVCKKLGISTNNNNSPLFFITARHTSSKQTFRKSRNIKQTRDQQHQEGVRVQFHRLKVTRVSVFRHENSELQRQAKQQMSAEHEESLTRGHAPAEDGENRADRAQAEQGRHPRACEQVETRIAENEHRQRGCGDDDDGAQDVDADEVLVLGVILAGAHERVVASADDADEHAADGG